MEIRLTLAILLIFIVGCDTSDVPQPAAESASKFVVAAILEAKELDEVSGIQSGAGGRFYLHNDEGSPSIYIADPDGRHLAFVGERNGRFDLYQINASTMTADLNK